MSDTTHADPLGPNPADDVASARLRQPPTAVSIVTIVLGVLVLLCLIASTGLNRFSTGSARTEHRTLAVDGVTGLDVHVEATSLTIGFGDVQNAELTTTGELGASAWRFARSGQLLELAPQDGIVNAEVFNFSPEIAVLTLPRSLESAGLTATVSLDAGSLKLNGAIDSLDLSVSAGSASVNLSGVRTAKYGLSAGSIRSRLSGAAPASVSIDVSAGDLNLRLPDAAYDLSRDVSFGGFSSSLREDDASAHRVDAQVSAGSVKLSAG